MPAGHLAANGTLEHLQGVVPQAGLHVVGGEFQVRLDVVPHEASQPLERFGGGWRVGVGHSAQIAFMVSAEIERIDRQSGRGDGCGVRGAIESAQQRGLKAEGVRVERVGAQRSFDLLECFGIVAASARQLGQLKVGRAVGLPVPRRTIEVIVGLLFAMQARAGPGRVDSGPRVLAPRVVACQPIDGPSQVRLRLFREPASEAWMPIIVLQRVSSGSRLKASR